MTQDIHYPKQTKGETTVFLSKGDTTAHFHQSYKIPPWSSHLFIMGVGPGAGGGNGKGAAAGTNRGGGGGGGSGAIASLWIPTFVLPRILWIYPGKNGLGGAPGGDATDAYISLLQDSSASGSILLILSGGKGGNTGGTTTGGTGGAGGLTVNQGKLAALGILTQTAGQTGSNGGNSDGTGTKNFNIAAMTNWCGSGCGGGGTDTTNTERAGGAYIGGNMITPNIPAGSSLGGRGGDGCFRNEPLYCAGGTGGGTNGASGTGGTGGNGAPGSGGGGGGAGVTGGTGGDGGPFMLRITAF